MFPVFHFMGALPANPETGTAAYAVGRDKGQLMGPYQNTLGVMAPETAKLAAFEKNGTPYTRPIMDGKMLNFEYTPFHLHNSMLPVIISLPAPAAPFKRTRIAPPDQPPR
jgi:hypothetical protein